MGNMSGSYGNHYTLWQSITVNSQNVANNKSNITVKMYLSFDGSSYYSYTNNTTSGTMIIEGSTYNYSISSINFSSGQAKDILLATWTGDIAHNTDGTKSLSVSGSWNTDTSRIGSGSCSVSKVLSTIPRASSISCSTANIEENAVITINSSSNSFTHKVIAYFGDETVTVATEKAGGTFQWTIPSSFYAQIPNSKTGVGTLTCETYASETLIGSKSIVLNITTSESKCRPTVTATVEDTNSATVALTGDSSKLIKYKSTAYVKVTPVAKNSATIKSTTVRNVTVTNNEISFANFSGSAFKVVTTDSRGYTNSEYILTPTIIQYIPLTLNATFFRPQPTTGEVQLTYSGNYFNGSFGYVSNEISFTWKYRKQGTSEWTTGGTITPTISGNTVKQTTISLGTEFDYQTAYDFQLVAVDKLTTLTITAKVSMGLPVFYWGKDFINVYGDIRKNDVSILPVTLYDDSTGTTGAVTLLENAVNFSYFEIFFRRASDTASSNQYSSVKVYSPDKKTVSLSLNHSTESKILQIYGDSILISGASITRCFGQIVNFGEEGFSSFENVTGVGKLYIVKVIG